MSFQGRRPVGVRSFKGYAGGVRGRLTPVVGLASALAAGSVAAQEVTAPQVPGQTAPQPPDTQPPPTPEDAYTLPTVEVVEEAEGYTATESSLTRVPRPLLDTPQSVTVVNEAVLEEQRATSVREALRNVSGITAAAGEGGRQGDAFVLRGFTSQADTARDGVRDLGWFTRDTFNLGGVEVFFGPSSVLFGRGSTGGAINLVTKKPARRTFYDVKLDAGTAPTGRVELDLNQAVSDDVQLRLNVMGQLAGVAGRDVVNENRAGVAPSARIALGKATTLELDYLYQRQDGVPDYGVPYFKGRPVVSTLDVPRNAFYGVEGSDAERVNAHVGTARVQHDLGNGWVLSDTLRLGGVDRLSRPTAPRGLTPTTGEPTTVGRQRFQTDTDNAYVTNQTELRAGFGTGPVKHTLVAGVELTRENRDQSRDNLVASGVAGGNLPADLFSPEHAPDLSAVAPVFNNANTSRQGSAGAYAADQVALTPWLELLGSVRLDVLRTKYTLTNAQRVQTALERTDRLFNWQGGVLVHPTEASSVYAMYGTSANPSAEQGTLSAENVSVDPERNHILELGGKVDLFDGRLNATASVFRIDKTNARVPGTDPAGPALVLEGAQRVQGVSGGVVGSVTERWRVFANYTFLDSEIREHTNPYLVGQALPQTPRHGLSLWTTVQVLEKLSLGGGAVFQSETVVNNPASEATALNRVPGYWRFDAVASYALGPAELQLNVNNLTNALYYDQYYAGHAVPAAGRSAVLSAKVRF